jgi:formate/nitrite transporter FocA (FNT family)
MAGVLLSFGNLLSEFVSAGSPGLNASNPGLVKILSGFVFPIGLVRSAIVLSYIFLLVHRDTAHAGLS